MTTIFDATTGKPVQNDISSVTVVAENGMLSDFLSTVIYAEGIEKGVKIAEDFDASVVIVNKDKSVLISEELKNKFDYIIIDTPPAGLVADAAIIAQYADASVMVVRRDHSSKRRIKKTIEDIEVKENALEFLFHVNNPP